MYGAPYVRDLDNNRRYGTLEDLNNFHKLAYMAPALHSSSSIICEPMEIAGSQAPPPHHPFGAEAFRQAVHGHRHVQGAGGRHDGDGRHRVRRGLCEGQPGPGRHHQLQFAAGLGRDDARRDEGLCAQQPAADPGAFRAVRRIDVGLCGRRGGAGQCRGARRCRLHPAAAPGFAADSTDSSW